jgi:type I restriction enzyme, S subunit
MELLTFLKYRKGKSVRTKTTADIDLLPILTPEYLRNNSEPELTSPTNNIVVGNDEIILLWDGSNAGEFFWSKRGVLASTMVVLDFDRSRFNLDYLYYSFKFFEPWLKTQTRGSGIPHVDKDIFLRHKIQELDKKEQTQIAKVLGTIDRAIAQTEALIAKHQRIKTGLMQDLLTRGIDKHGQLRDPSTHGFKSTPLGIIPDEWDVAEIQTKLSSIIDYRGKTPRKTASGTWLITARNVRDGYLSPEPKEFIATETYDEWMTRGIPSPGDVLFTTEAPMGFVARIPHGKVAVGQRILTLVAHPTVLDSDFLFWLLHWENTKERLKLMTTGSTVTGIKQAVFKKVIMQFPKTDEQQSISNILNSANKKIESIQTELSKLRRLKAGLMQDLLSGRVSVKPLMEE